MSRPAALAVLVACLLVPAAAASAEEVVLAPAAGDTAITAIGGQVVLSHHDPATGRWSLMRWHNGVMDRLPVAERSVPFDADAGSDAQGKPVVVYSKCAADPQPPQGLAISPDWETARGCDVYELPLTGEPAERKLTVASSASASETTPSMWRGALAFARHADGARLPTVRYLPADARAGAGRRLGGGSAQVCGGAQCVFPRYDDDVDQLDLGPARVAYVWRMTGGSVSGTGVGWELRSAALRPGPSTLLDAGVISGACGFRLPSGPDASAAPIAYLLAGATCDVTLTRFATADPVTGILRSAPITTGLAAGAARDGATLYWLRVTGNGGQVPVPGATTCESPAVTCELVSNGLPAYAAGRQHRPGSPGDTDPVRSGEGYTWFRAAGGVRLLRPPGSVPCAPSAFASYVAVSAQWSAGHHRVTIQRTSAGGSHAVGGPITRSVPAGVVAGQTQLLHCGSRMRLTYTVTTGGRAQHVHFAVARAKSP